MSRFQTFKCPFFTEDAHRELFVFYFILSTPSQEIINMNTALSVTLFLETEDRKLAHLYRIIEHGCYSTFMTITQHDCYIC